MSDCQLFTEIIDKFYGYKLDVQPKCCDDAITICNNKTRIIKILLPNYGLRGFIPLEIGELNLLEGLYLSDNQLKGPIPAELGKLRKLERLELQNNLLEGPIPKELSQCSLIDLKLQSNSLTGTIPGQLGDLQNLTQFIVTDNFLEGVIPFNSKVPNSLFRFEPQKEKPLGPAVIPAIVVSAIAVSLGIVIAIAFFRRRRLKARLTERGDIVEYQGSVKSDQDTDLGSDDEDVVVITEGRIQF